MFVKKSSYKERKVYVVINITTKELLIERELKKKLDIIFSFCNIKPKYINGSIRKIEKTNLCYVEPHRVILKNITLLVFNYQEEVYINNLYEKVKLTELEQYLKNLS